MHRAVFFVITAFIVLLPLGLYLTGWLDDPAVANRPIVFHFFDKDETPVATTDAIPGTGIGAPAPAPKAGEIASANGNMVVSSLARNQVLPNPFVLLGRARAFEFAVEWRVKDSRGAVVAKGSATTDAVSVEEFGGFRVRAFYSRVPDSPAGTVEVFTRSPRDGSEQELVVLPVRFPEGTTAVQAFFPNQEQDPNVEHCEVTYPVTRRVPETEEVMEAAVLELLKGPTALEQLTGSRTAMIPGAGLRRVARDGDTVSVDFTKQFALGIAGSCTVQALRSQVEQTLKQFQGVREVKIMVEGADAEQYLQP